ICGLYERKLKKLNPTTRNITYYIGDLYNFIDGLTDIIALAEKDLAKARMNIAHEVRKAKEAEAEMDMHVAKAGNMAKREVDKHASETHNRNANHS
ncbi:Enhancer of rudimentary - like 1, partial [Theobroma cacao]